MFGFADHGEASATIDAASGEPDRVLGEAAEAGIDLDRITAELEREGIEAFCTSYERLLERIESKLAPIYPAAA